VSGQGGTKVIIIKKKAKHAGHHGGAWKVAYADFVTAMMALFIVLWLLTQSDEASKERIAQYFRTGMLPGGTLTIGQPAGSNPPIALNIFPSGSMGGPNVSAPERAIAAEIDTIIKAVKAEPGMDALGLHLKVKSTTEGTLIELVDGDDNFMFPVGSSGLKPGAVKLLENLAPIFARMRNKIEIHGHTDGRPFEPGARKTNWDLSFERANEARRVLEQSGVAAGRIVGVQAHADTSPINKKEPLAPENRRLSLLILKDKPKSAKTKHAAESSNPFEEPAKPSPQGKE
jgi:chemotaxis protein MotB